MTQDISNAIGIIADKLQVPVTQVFNVLIEQSKLQIGFDHLYIWLFGIGALIFLIFSIFSLVLAISDDAATGIPVLAFAIVTLIMIIGIVLNYQEIITCTINPKFWALQQIFGSISH